MKKVLNYFVIVFFFAVSFLIPQKTFAENYSAERLFYLPEFNAVDGVKSLAENWDKIDILAPQYYTVNSKLFLVGGLGPKLKSVIKEHKIKVMPLVSNAHFSQKLIHSLLTSIAKQNSVINDLVFLAKKDKYIGWQFDFENINYADKDLYTAFVKRAYTKFQKNKLVLSVVVVPRDTDLAVTDAFVNWSGVYDYKALAENSDFVTLMTYDDPNSVGPVASLSFVNQMLAYVKDKIPAEKLSLGVPLYYWKWSVADNTKLGSGKYSNAVAIEKKYQCTSGFDADLGATWLDYFYKNKEYKIWLEDQKSFEKKLQIVTNNKFRGFSAWMLGGEDPAIWSILSQNH